MAGSNFVDYVKIFARAGHGGAGSSHFRREKFVAFGGPDGGDGGRVVASSLRAIASIGHLFTLSISVTNLLKMVSVARVHAQAVRMQKISLSLCRWVLLLVA